MKIKQVKIIPDNEQDFVSAINENTDLTDIQKRFFIDSTQYTIGHVDNCDDFYIDKPYKFNLYDYSQKFTTIHRLKARKFGFTGASTETNFFNYDKNLVSEDHTTYLKLKNKVGYTTYYNYIKQHLDWFDERDEFLIVKKPPAGETMRELVFDTQFIDSFFNYLLEHFHKGLWLNNFNHYSIRYNREKKKFYSYDPDMFFVIDQNPDIKHLSTDYEFLDTYRHYKLRKKDIIYRVSDPYGLTTEVLEYMYYSYWFLENVAQGIRNRL